MGPFVTFPDATAVEFLKPDSGIAERKDVNGKLSKDVEWN